MSFWARVSRIGREGYGFNGRDIAVCICYSWKSVCLYWDRVNRIEWRLHPEFPKTASRRSMSAKVFGYCTRSALHRIPPPRVQRSIESSRVPTCCYRLEPRTRSQSLWTHTQHKRPRSSLVSCRRWPDLACLSQSKM